MVTLVTKAIQHNSLSNRQDWLAAHKRAATRTFNLAGGKNCTTRETGDRKKNEFSKNVARTLTSHVLVRG
jgi:hypothetical protein